MTEKSYTSAALFDLDHTLFRCNSSFAFGRYLYKRKIISLWSLLHLAFVYYRCKLGYVTLQQMHEKAFQAFFKGKNIFDISKYIDPWLDADWDKMIRPDLYKELQAHRSNNTYTALLSNSPDFIVGPISKRFLMDDYKGTHYQIDAAGKFAEIGTRLEGQDKAAYILQLNQNLGISKDKVTAYSDSMLDLPFLKEAGTPVCVAPDPKLRVFALENQWKVME